MVKAAAIITFLVMLIKNRHKLVFDRKNKVEAYTCIYLLTIGLVSSTIINSILIITTSLWNLNIKKADKKLLFIILLNATYLTLNTFLIFSKKSFDSQFNPYMGLIELLVYFLYILMIQTSNFNKDEKIEIIEVISLFSIGILFGGIIEMISSGFEQSLRMVSAFQSPNQLGIYGTIIFSLNHQKHAKYIGKNSLKLIKGCSVIMILLSQSRVAWLAFLMYLIISSFKTDIRKKVSILLKVMPLIIIVLIIFNDQISYMYNERFLSVFNLNDDSTVDRISLASAAIEIFKRHFLFGTGIRTFYHESYLLNYVYNSANVVQPHNAYLELLQSVGLIGFILHFILIIYLYRRSKKNITFLATLIMFLTVGTLSRLFNDFPTTILFWTFLCFSVKSIDLEELDHERI